MATRIKCTGRDFIGITNPYTGEPVVTEMIVGKDGACLFGAPDTYSPAAWRKTKEEAYALWCREEGIEDVRKGQKIVCAFSGAELVLEEDPDLGFRYSGGFDPRIFRKRHEYLNGITMRGGKLTRPEYVETPHVMRPGHTVYVTHREIQVDDEHMRRAEQAMHDANFSPEKKTRVSMSQTTKKGGRRK